jgi:putative DNA primase/helicase
MYDLNPSETSNKPSSPSRVVPPIFDGIATELLDYPHFVVWRKEPRFENDDPTKILYDPKTGRRASSTDPTTWASFVTARTVFEQARGRFAGIGFVFSDRSPFFGVDLDDCRNPVTGEIIARSRVIIERFKTYSEVSPSFCGVKMIGKGGHWQRRH